MPEEAPVMMVTRLWRKGGGKSWLHWLPMEQLGSVRARESLGHGEIGRCKGEMIEEDGITESNFEVSHEEDGKNWLENAS